MIPYLLHQDLIQMWLDIILVSMNARMQETRASHSYKCSFRVRTIQSSIKIDIHLYKILKCVCVWSLVLRYSTYYSMPPKGALIEDTFCTSTSTYNNKKKMKYWRYFTWTFWIHSSTFIQLKTYFIQHAVLPILAGTNTANTRKQTWQSTDDES